MSSTSTPAASRTARTQQGPATHGMQDSWSVGEHSSNCSMSCAALLQTMLTLMLHLMLVQLRRTINLRPCVPDTINKFERAQTPHISLLHSSRTASGQVCLTRLVDVHAGHPVSSAHGLLCS